MSHTHFALKKHQVRSDFLGSETVAFIIRKILLSRHFFLFFLKNNK